ncbi:hypothetical protein SFR_2122 [Streptomyces sp. FR-008]|nr:hypothetical protein SFR_2122 [Streptomyces sp. FR-008]
MAHPVHPAARHRQPARRGAKPVDGGAGRSTWPGPERGAMRLIRADSPACIAPSCPAVSPARATIVRAVTGETRSTGHDGTDGCECRSTTEHGTGAAASG